jgi:hypothetical protein
MKIAFLKNKNRNDSISIGASVIIDELSQNGVKVDICDYQTAFDYDVVLVSMTATEDLFDLYGNMHREGWQRRKFTAIVGGFGCQNPFALADFVDYAFFGRADGVIFELIKAVNFSAHLDKYCQNVLHLKRPRPVQVRQTETLYPRPVRYGKNNAVWTEKFVGCVYKCKFCHYSWNRQRIGGDTYINDGLSAGSPEILFKDICNRQDKFGRFTTALDGYSERLRNIFGKKISWEMVENSLDHVASFRGNTYIKLYNIHNFPSETETDREEFFKFFENYAENSMKPDGIVTVEVLNTAFRPSLNTPMHRLEARLYPPARYEDTRVAIGDGFVFKMSVNNRDAYSHLQDLISIRYTTKHADLVHFISTDKAFSKLNNTEKLQAITARWDITDFLRRYDLSENLPFNFIKTSQFLQNQEKNLLKIL